MKQYTYLLIDVFCMIVPFIFSFHPKLSFYKSWKYFIFSCTPVAIFFIFWDAVFTHQKIWSFNPDLTLPVRIFGLPLEEVLFFFCIPYACTFTYFCLRIFLRSAAAKTWPKVISLFLIFGLLVVAVFNLSRLYTSVTFVLLASWLIILLVRRVKFLPVFFVTWFIILIPFIISNGLLTGSFSNEAVVLYNDNYNLGLRILNIPVEDVFYGMLLILMNITLFERIESGSFTMRDS